MQLRKPSAGRLWCRADQNVEALSVTVKTLRVTAGGIKIALVHQKEGGP